MLKILSLSITILALLWVTEGRAADTHEGKVVETSSGKLTMTDTAGKNQHTMQIPATATVMRDGKTAMLTDLKPGDMITVTTEKTGDTTAVTKIEATPSGS